MPTRMNAEKFPVIIAVLIFSSAFRCCSGFTDADTEGINYKFEFADSRVGDEVGYYTVDYYTTVTCELGHYCENGTRFLCPAGRYGGRQGLSSSECMGNCSEGYYCPEGSKSAKEVPCGNPMYFCPSGSKEPQKVDTGYYSVGSSRQVICETGHYCMFGVKHTCPPGTYGSQTGMSDPSHCLPSPLGYYAPRASTTPQKCGSVDLYCPAESPYPTKVLPGYYTSSANVSIYSTKDNCGFGVENCTVFRNYNSLHWHQPTVVGFESVRHVQKVCEPGFYCPGDGQRYECPPGRYGAQYALTHESCTGECASGYYCPAKSNSSNQNPCGSIDGAAVYCPEGSGTPYPVDPGYFTVVSPVTYGSGLNKANLVSLEAITQEYQWRTSKGWNAIHSIISNRFKHMHASAQTICAKGHYCVKGIQYQCSAGKYGGEEGLGSPVCSGFCDAGYYCPTASVSPKERKCGSADYYCPVGSATPRKVPLGYYSIGNDNATRVSIALCEPGFYCKDGIRYTCEEGYYGKNSGLYTLECDGKCSAGYFCPPGSTSSLQNKCGDVAGLTADGNTFHESIGPTICVTYMLPVFPRQFIEFTLLETAENEHIDTTLWDISMQSLGGMTNAMKNWSDEHIAWESDGSQGSYIATRWKPREGPKTFCMWKMFTTEDIFGIDGIEKIEGVNDYFMMGTYFSHRDKVFASSGENRGTYSNVKVMINKNEWVFYCLTSGGVGGNSVAYVATPADTLYGPIKVWEQSNNGNDRGVIGPGNGLGMVYGEGSKALYGGIIHWDYYLNETEIGTVYKVLSRFYPGHGGLRTKNQMLCGWYNSNEWAQGHHGRHQGPFDSVHLEKRADIDHNYYWVPSKPGLKQKSIGIGSIKWRHWYRDRFPKTKITIDSLAHSQQQELLGGGNSFYCPQGSGFPIHVANGFYTSGSSDGLTQKTQQICEPGYFCIAGRKFPCFQGYFGNESGMVTKECSGFCPAGTFCPEGSIIPKTCPMGTYAVAGSSKCAPCPIKEKATCTTSRRCCK